MFMKHFKDTEHLIGSFLIFDIFISDFLFFTRWYKLLLMNYSRMHGKLGERYISR